MAAHLNTTRYYRGRLPHWEVLNGRYFVTVRCGDSIPADIAADLAAISSAMSEIEPASDAFEELQRQYFRTIEKYMNAGYGRCALANTEAARVVVEELEALRDWSIPVPHYTIMPNHWHAIIEPAESCSYSLRDVMRRVKGRSAVRIQRTFGWAGRFWQREWFDRWIRNDAEYERCVGYIRRNPVVAGIACRVGEHGWTV